MALNTRLPKKLAERHNLLQRIADHPPSREDFIHFYSWDERERESATNKQFDAQLAELGLSPRRTQVHETRREKFVRLMLRAKMLALSGDASDILVVTPAGHRWLSRIAQQRYMARYDTLLPTNALLSFGS